MMMIILFITGFYNAHAQNYNVLLIPDSLTKNANYVIRNDEYNIEVKSMEDVVIHHKYAITVLNENGDAYAVYHNTYTKDEPLNDIDGNLYDALGKKLKNIKRKDIHDEPLEDGFSLMRDTRVKYHNWYWKNYPYTVEYEDEQELNQILFLPDWSPVHSFYCSVQNSQYSIKYPQAIKLRFRPVNYTTAPQATNDKSISMSWNLSNFKAVSYEPLMPALSKLQPKVMIAPSDFTYGGYHGNLSTWADFGKFQLLLNKDRDVLPDDVKTQVHTLADGLRTKEEKVAALYQYLQNNSRYISVQLGIGGWQPFDAKYVAANKYGDCKALSNFMVSLLKEAGIPANYVIVKAEKSTASDYVTEDFPGDYFNHVICCVPNGKDSIWLECTNQTTAPGYMGTFTGNRKALLVADDGGHIVSTPFYKAVDNEQIRAVNSTIDASGNLDAEVNTVFSGTQEEDEHDAMYYYTKDEREKYLNNSIQLATYKVEKNEYSEEKKSIPVVHQNLHITSPGYASLTGKRLFVKPNMFNKSNLKLSKDSVRKYAINFHWPYRDVDSVNITLPEGYRLESMPKDVALNTKFGNYSISFTTDGSHLKMIRTDERSANTFPAADYNDLVAFYDAIFKADRSQFVFVKKEN